LKFLAITEKMPQISG